MRGPEKACGKGGLSLPCDPGGSHFLWGTAGEILTQRKCALIQTGGHWLGPCGVGEDGGGGKGHSKTETSPDRDLSRTETSPGQRPPQAETSLGRDLPRQRRVGEDGGGGKGHSKTEISPVQRSPPYRDLPRTETSVGCRTHLAEQFPVPRDNGMKTRIKLSIFSKF